MSSSKEMVKVAVVMPPAIAHEKPHRCVDGDPEKTTVKEDREVSVNRLDRLLNDYGVRPPYSLSFSRLTEPGNMDFSHRPIQSLQLPLPPQVPHRHHLLLRSTYPHYVGFHDHTLAPRNRIGPRRQRVNSADHHVGILPRHGLRAVLNRERQRDMGEETSMGSV
jgi:hypothetical protein